MSGHLETFLGGMETCFHRLRRIRVVNPLKPSLVEWKRVYRPFRGGRRGGLETFLGGMETGFHKHNPLSAAPP